MRSKFKSILYIIVLFSYSFVQAGSYDDFFEAVLRDDARAVQALLNRGFDPNTVSPKGQYGLILAVREASFKVVDVLLDLPATQVEVRTVNDESALMLAALKGYAGICQRLIARDADVNKTGWAPLHYAATGGHLDILRMLLENHAYIDAASPNGSTPLMMAAMFGTIDAVKLLLQAGADATLKNTIGLDAIGFAQQVQRDDVVAVISAAIRSQRPVGSW